jgi:hypothetical protein
MIFYKLFIAGTEIKSEKIFYVGITYGIFCMSY